MSASDQRTFMQMAIADEVGVDAIEEFVSEWHRSESTKPIHEYLGLTWYEYGHWMTRSAMLKYIVLARRNNMSVDEFLGVGTGMVSAPADQFADPSDVAELRAWVESRPMVSPQAS